MQQQQDHRTGEDAGQFTLWRAPTVTAVSGLPPSTLYDHVKKRLFTRPVRLSRRCVGWPRVEVEAINAARIAEKSDDEIRQLVINLEAARKGDASKA